MVGIVGGCGATPCALVRLVSPKCEALWCSAVPECRVFSVWTVLHVLLLWAPRPCQLGWRTNGSRLQPQQRRRRPRRHMWQWGNPLMGMAQHVPPVTGCHGSLHEVALHHLDRGVSSVTSRHRCYGTASRLHAPPPLDSECIDRGWWENAIAGQVRIGSRCGHPFLTTLNNSTYYSPLPVLL